MNSVWRNFLDEIARWRDAGMEADFWWRDDDARWVDPALTRLLALSHATRVPLALAVIPHGVQRDAFTPCPDKLVLMQHGTDHLSRAAVGEKKTEFPVSESVPDALARLVMARTQWQHALHGMPHASVLVPPWNRISSAAVVGQLAAAGYRGLSRFGPRNARDAAPGLVQANTHVDIIDWRGSRGFAGEEAVLAQATSHLLARRTGAVDSTEPTGWLTHHAVHDEPAWGFMQRLFERTTAGAGVRWLGAQEVFGVDAHR